MKKALAAAAGAIALAVTTLVSTPFADVPPGKGAPAGAPVGFVDRPVEAAILGPRVDMAGWVHSAVGVRAVEVRWEGGKRAARIGAARQDVITARRDLTGREPVAWHFEHDFDADPPPPGWDRRRLAVVAIGEDGKETQIAGRDLVERAAFTSWKGVAPGGAPFYILPATSGVSLGGAAELESDYRAYISDTVKVGVRVPILYMRTTLGGKGDYVFDPGWDIERRCGERRIADDSLTGVLTYARDKKLPVLVTLNGGIWADSPCDVPDWDLNDRLEADPANCQWNNSNEVRKDDALRNLPGSQASPELGRSLTYNVYAAEVRRLKKRNLQQAVRLLVEFDRRNPGLLVGINLDPDVYLNPFYAQREWYDFNPGTLRQFRHWLAGTGPYAGKPEPGAPDLKRYAREKPLTLAQAGALAEREFKSWDEVDPPRKFPREGPRPYWKDPWVYEWEQFRRHLVKLHFDELSAWVVEAGIGSNRIWSAQGFTPHYEDSMPLATRLSSSVRNYDTAGVSVEGSKPASGHLGAIIYGPSAANEVILEEGASLFATFLSFDTEWGAVEFNTTALRTPRTIPPPSRGHQALRGLWNYQARFVSPMAWNGSHGHYTHHPAYVPFTSWRGTPAEEAAKDFMLARAGLPRGTRLWTFGTPTIADRDGWTTAAGKTVAQRASLRVEPGAGALAMIDSPRELAIGSAARVVVRSHGKPLDVEVWARARGDPPQRWTRLARGDSAAGVAIPRVEGGLDQLRLGLRLPSGPVTVTRIAVLPTQK